MVQFDQKEFRSVLDTLIQEIDSKVLIIQDAFRVLLTALNPEKERPAEGIAELCKAYEEILPSPTILEAEMEMFLHFIHKTNHENEGQIVAISYREAADKALQSAATNKIFIGIAKAYKLLLTAAPIVCKDERIFSKLKLLKNFTRSLMSNDRLRSLMLLYYKKDITDRLCLKDIVNKWANLKRR